MTAKQIWFLVKLKFTSEKIFIKNFWKASQFCHGWIESQLFVLVWVIKMVD